MTVTDKMYPTQHLPEAVTQVKKELVKSFSHSKRVGGYLLGRTLGVGSFAKVKEGLHLTTGEKVAIKVIDKKRTKTDNYVRKNLRREGRLLQMVRHPNIVSLLEVMETDNSYYLVTEICKGGDLMEYISNRKRLPEMEVTKFIGQIVSAVDYLHRLGIIHRDLKIENLLLDGNRDIKLIDFGLSNFIKVATTPDGAKSQEFCVTQCGSPAYAAPELLNHEKYGLQVDLWSIGVNMYAMLTGGLPFTVEPFNIKALYAKMRDRQMNPLPDDLSRECRDLLRKFLNPDPARRVTIGEALNHPWLMQGNKSITRVPCPNKIKTSDLEPEVLSHLSENLGFRMGEVIKFVTCNTPSPACATYHLFVEKLRRYNATLRSSGQVPATFISRSPGDEGQGRITLHLRDMRNKQIESHQNNSTGIGTPTSRTQSRAINSVATDATDVTVATTASSGKRETTGKSKNAERKENQKPRRASEAPPRAIVMMSSRKSPSLSDVSSCLEDKKQATSAHPLQQGVNQRALLHLHDPPLPKGNTALGVILRHHSKDTHGDERGHHNHQHHHHNNATNTTAAVTTIIKSAAKAELQPQGQGQGQTHTQATKIIVSDGGSGHHRNPAATTTTTTTTTTGKSTIVVKLTPRHLTQIQQQRHASQAAATGGGGQSEKATGGCYVPKPFLEKSNISNTITTTTTTTTNNNNNNIHRNGFPERSHNSNPFSQHRKILTRQTTTGRSFDSTSSGNNSNNNNNHHNSITVASTNDKSGHSNVSNHVGGGGGGGADFPFKHIPVPTTSTATTVSSQPEPTVRKIIPKQFVPFRSAAQDRPRVSKNYAPTPFRQPDKATKAMDGSSTPGGNNHVVMSLQGKTVARRASDEDFSPPIKRPSSPHRPVVVRRRLVKRHRLGDITGSGGQVIRDVDQSVTTDLLGSDVVGPIGNSHHMSTPLPSIGQSSTPR